MTFGRINQNAQIILESIALILILLIFLLGLGLMLNFFREGRKAFEKTKEIRSSYQSKL